MLTGCKQARIMAGSSPACGRWAWPWPCPASSQSARACEPRVVHKNNWIHSSTENMLKGLTTPRACASVHSGCWDSGRKTFQEPFKIRDLCLLLAAPKEESGGGGLMKATTAVWEDFYPILVEGRDLSEAAQSSKSQNKEKKRTERICIQQANNPP